MDVAPGKVSPDKLHFKCNSCGDNYEMSIKEFIVKKLSKILDIEQNKLVEAYKKGTLKFYENRFITALQFRKSVVKIEAGTMVCLSKDIQVVRGFPKIRRTLMLNGALKSYFQGEVAVEEKMNGYNVRIALIDSEIVAFTRGGYVCPYTTKKAPEVMDLNRFFADHADLVICGEMLGTDNPYVSHYYPEIGKLGFRVFDLRQKLTGKPLPINEKRELLLEYELPPVNLMGIFSVLEAPSKILKVVKKMGAEGREGVVIKDPQMELPPLKYTSSQAHDDELVYAFKFPFDLGKAFFFSRVIREGFQSFEMKESEEEKSERAQRLGESILYPMLETIKQVSAGDVAGEDLVMDAESPGEVKEFLRHLRDLGVVAVALKYEDGKAVIRRVHQSTTDKISNYLDGGLY